MVTALLIGIGCLFFVMGHSALLYFKSEGVPSLPIADVIFPWPAKGRVLCVLCLALSVASVCLVLLLPAVPHAPVSPSVWKIMIIFAILPNAIYARHLWVRIQRRPEGFVYFSSDASHHGMSLSLPMLLSALLLCLLWIF